MTVNRSEGIAYHSQRNNLVVPLASCNTTSIVMALLQAGHTLPPHDGQPEDALSRHLQTQEAFAKQRELAPWSVKDYPPQEVHVVLEWGTNSWMGAEVDAFTDGMVKQGLHLGLQNGCGFALSGKFPRRNGSVLGHIVSLAGYVEHGGVVVEWIIDDPYGDWHTDYTDHHGNNVFLTDADFDAIFRKGHTYWAHVIGAKG